MNIWVANEETRREVLGVEPARRLHALLDGDGPPPAAGVELPALWHWLYFLPDTASSGLGPDGHPMTGGFLPPAPYPRRMFAGSEIRTTSPLVLGGSAMRSAKASRPVEKSGRSGPLAFVVVDLDITADEGGHVVERQQIVYRPAQPVSRMRGSAAVPDWPWRFELDAEERLLFRFSALTYNAHRIHYDKPFATAIDGYPGLVVQGPLLAIGLAEVIRRNAPDRRIVRFEFRAAQPAFAPTRITFLGDLDGDLVNLVAVDESDVTLMTASATIS